MVADQVFDPLRPCPDCSSRLTAAQNAPYSCGRHGAAPKKQQQQRRHGRPTTKMSAWLWIAILLWSCLVQLGCASASRRRTIANSVSVSAEQQRGLVELEFQYTNRSECILVQRLATKSLQFSVNRMISRLQLLQSLLTWGGQLEGQALWKPIFTGKMRCVGRSRTTRRYVARSSFYVTVDFKPPCLTDAQYYRQSLDRRSRVLPAFQLLEQIDTLCPRQQRSFFGNFFLSMKVNVSFHISDASALSVDDEDAAMTGSGSGSGATAAANDPAYCPAHPMVPTAYNSQEDWLHCVMTRRRTCQPFLPLEDLRSCAARQAATATTSASSAATGAAATTTMGSRPDAPTRRVPSTTRLLSAATATTSSASSAATGAAATTTMGSRPNTPTRRVPSTTRLLPGPKTTEPLLDMRGVLCGFLLDLSRLPAGVNCTGRDRGSTLSRRATTTTTPPATDFSHTSASASANATTGTRFRTIGLVDSDPAAASSSGAAATTLTVAMAAGFGALCILGTGLIVALVCYRTRHQRVVKPAKKGTESEEQTMNGDELGTTTMAALAIVTMTTGQRTSDVPVHV